LVGRCISKPSTSSQALDERPAAARIDSHRASGSIYSSNIAPEALTIPRQHPQTHGIPVGILHLRSYDPTSLTLFIHFALHAAYAFGIPASRAASLPSKRSLYTVIRSPFVHKKSQENFERVIHRRAIKLWDTDMDVFNKWARYLEINALGGVDMRFVRWERVEIGFGEKRLAEVVRYEQELWESSQKNSAGGNSAGNVMTKKQVEKVAREIVEAELAASRAVDEGLASMDPRLQRSKPVATSSTAAPSSFSPEVNPVPPESTSSAASGSSNTPEAS
jgi:ribosomal protein S10